MAKEYQALNIQAEAARTQAREIELQAHEVWGDFRVLAERRQALEKQMLEFIRDKAIFGGNPIIMFCASCAGQVDLRPPRGCRSPDVHTLQWPLPGQDPAG
jgi:hypothetical protein